MLSVRITSEHHVPNIPFIANAPLLSCSSYIAGSSPKILQLAS